MKQQRAHRSQRRGRLERPRAPPKHRQGTECRIPRRAHQRSTEYMYCTIESMAVTGVEKYITAFQKFEEPGTDDSLVFQLQFNGAYYPQFAADMAVHTVKFVHRSYGTQYHCSHCRRFDPSDHCHVFHHMTSKGLQAVISERKAKLRNGCGGG